MPIHTELSDIETTIIDAAKSAPSPVFVHMLGIPGSGKSSFLNILQQEWQKKANVTLLGFDQIMQMIPSYQNMTDKIDGFRQFELPAREAGYRILDGLLKKRAHILFDNGGSAESHPDMMRYAKDQLQYKLIFLSIHTPIEVARSRVDARAIETGQHTPLHYLGERYQKLQNLIPAYREMAHAFYQIDNVENDMKKFIEQSNEVVLDIIDKNL